MTKKLPIAAIIVLVLVLLLSFTGCLGNQITITFDTMGGGYASSISVELTAESLTLPVPTKEGYEFDYWCYDSECSQRVDTSIIPEESTTFYAKWSAKLVTITFITTHPVTNQVTRQYAYVSYGDNYLVADMPSNEAVDGFDVIWLTNDLTSVTAPLTIYSRYSEKKISVTYYVDGQEYLSHTDVAQTTVQLPDTPIKEGYYFAGWYYDTDSNVRSNIVYDKIPDASVNLYAKFIDISESFRFYTYTAVGANIKITGLTAIGSVQAELVIPRTINGNNVTSIGYTNDNAGALSLSVFNSKYLQRIVIPDTVETLGSFAFYGATALKEVIIEGNSLVSLGTGAFANCRSLQELNLPNSVTTIGKYCFAGIAISSASSNNLELIGEGAWSTTDNWTKTTMAFARLNLKQESSLYTINNYAFFNLPSFTTFRLPKNLASVNYLAFLDSGLATVNTFVGGNFDSYLGAVYSADGKTLIYYPLKGEATFTLKSGTTSIASYAFYDNKNVTTITANNELLSVGQYAFYNCTSLINFDFNGNAVFTTVGAFAFAKSAVNSFSAPVSLTIMGQGAFKEAKSLITVNFAGNNLGIVPQEAFYGCSALNTIAIPSSTTTIGKYAFYDCLALATLSFSESSVLSTIDDYAFANCVSISTLAFPSTIRSINKYAFAGIDGKMNLDLSAIPSEITALGDYAFSNTKINSFSINSNLRTLGIGVFKNCASLTRFTITLSDYVTSIPDEMFYGCSLLNQFTFPNTIQNIGNYAFFSCIRLADLTFNVSGSNGMLSIGNSAFEGCTLLKSGDSTKRIIPTTVTSVGTRAFYGCSTITRVYIPMNLSYLSAEAFAYCSSLTNINYDQNGTLATIGENAFAYCTSLTSAILPVALAPRDDLDTTGCIKNPFIGCSKLTAFTIPTNPNYYILDGIVYRNLANGKQIYLFPTAKSVNFSVGTDVTSIDRYAFYGSAVTAINFSNNPPVSGVETISLVKIGAYAFSRSQVATATISKRVYDIEENAFSYSALNELIIEATFVSSTNINYVITNNGVTSNTLEIGNYAFKNTNLTYLNAPERLTNIKTGAFSECYNLKTLAFASSTSFALTIGDYAFFSDNSITSLTLPQQLSLVGDYAFANCFNMQNIAFSYLESLHIELVIGAYAFSNNQYLYAVTLPMHLKEMGEGVFSNDSRLAIVNFPSSLNITSLAIPKLAFFGASSLKNIVLPDYISDIGEQAFLRTNLESVSLGNNVDLSIGSYAFSGITSFKTIYLPESVTTIGEYAFYQTGLTSFTYATTGKGIAILDYAFAGTNLVNVVLNARFVSLGDYAFANTNNLTSASIIGGITTLGANAFENSKLTTITLDSSIKNIGAYAFSGTSNLVGINGCFENIGDYAFYNSAIAYYTCGSTLNNINIGVRSFANCNNLVVIDLETSGSASIGDFAFAETNNLTTLKISGNFSDIGTGIAYNALSLRSIEITDNSSTYYCDDGVLYLASGAEITLLQYPAGKIEATATLPIATTVIDDYAFFGNNHLLSIVIPSDTMLSKSSNSLGATNSNLKIYVAENLVANYKEQWNINNVAFITTELDGFVLKYLGNDNYSIIDYAGSASVLTIEGFVSVDIGGNNKSYRIIQIEDYAFANNNDLTSVTIGSGINIIYNYAFANCINLETVIIGDNVLSIRNYAFANCGKLDSITFGTNLSSIGGYAFVNCHALISLILPNNLTAIGDYAFSGATNLSTISLSNNLQSLGNNAFEYNTSLITITFPASLKTINDNVFYGCEKLTFLYVLSVQAPLLKSENAFRNTSESILFFVNENSKNNYKGDRLWRTYSSKIMSISDICGTENFNDYVLQHISGNNYRLLSYLGTEESVIIQSNISAQIKITEIGSYAISHFTKNVTLAEGIIALNENAFANATSLINVTLPSSLQTIGKNAFAELTLLETVMINDFANSNLSVIADYAFYNTTSIASFALPKNIASIGNYAFAKTIDNALVSFVFNSLTSNIISIGEYAFSGNALLKSLTFECYVKSLGEGAFSNCINLEAIYFNSLGSSATAIAISSTKVFENCNKLSVFVRSDSMLTSFRQAWNNTLDKNKLSLKTLIAKDTEDIIGQNDFVISIMSGSSNLATIINYLGTDTVVTFPSNITVNNITYTITKIGREESGSTAISGYVIGASVTKVIIPAAVTTIGTDAFRSSLSLETVELALDSALTSVGRNAFSDCPKLKNINLPKTLISIGNYAFANCRALNNITFANLPANNPASLDIKEYAFANCSALVNITLPLHIRTIGVYAFSGATSLSSFVLTEECKLATIAGYAFKDTAITSLYLPTTVTNVADYCFRGCTALRSIYLNREIGNGNNTSTIAGNNVFDNDSSPFIKIYVPLTSHTSYSGADGWSEKAVIPNLSSGEYNYIINLVGTNTVTLTNYLGTSTTLYIPSSLEINSISYRVTAINKYAGNERIKEVVFDANNYVTALNKYAFAGCTALEKIHLPDSITSIEEYAFYNCTALNDITLPSQLSDIKSFTFANCTALTEIRVPALVLSLGNSAFMSCTKLSRLIVDIADPKALGANALQQTPSSLKIVVADNLISLFSSEWSAFSTNIVGKDSVLGDFIVEHNGANYTLIQYNGKNDIDLTNLTFFGGKITEIAEGSIIDKTVVITIGSNVTYYSGITTQVILQD